VAKRIALSKRDVRSLIRISPEPLSSVLDKADLVEVHEIVENKLYAYVADGIPLMAKITANRNEYLVPTLYFIYFHPSGQEVMKVYPNVVVDSGAVPHVLNGADVMRPGIVSFNGGFKANDVVLVLDGRGRTIAIGAALNSREEVEQMTKGKVLLNLHHLGDRLWNFCKELRSRSKTETSR